jgi:acyl-CoA synthetase (AMP-forming)/AMP-acid ligase II/acyl carrier protein
MAAAGFLAALLDGLVPVMLSHDSKPDRIRAIQVSVEPALVVADARVAEELATIPTESLRLVSIAPSTQLDRASMGLTSAWRNITRLFKQHAEQDDLGLPAEGREPRLPPPDDSLGYILFTSGTTSAPSGVEISRNGLMAHLETLTRLFGYGPGSRIFNATPLAHTDGLVQGLLLAAANGAVLLRPGAFALTDLEAWLDRLVSFEATHFITNPTVLGLIYRFASQDDYFLQQSFYGILSSASILRADLWEKFETRFGCGIYNMYGMTETVANATYAGRHPEMGPPGTIGIPVDCEVRLMELRPDGSLRETDVEGELQVRGENVFKGYWKNPDRTAETLLSGGWMRTGDLARRRPDGALDIVGRVKTMINMGGQSVLPEEIDEVLAMHPAVLDVATVGVSDPEFEEVAVSTVVLETPATEGDLLAHCRRRLEPLKVPKRIFVLEEIPRGDAGKPRAGELRGIVKLLMGGLAAAPTADSDAPVSQEAVYALAAEVFRVPAGELSAGSSPATVDGWDSFNQLNLMIEAETRFGVRIPASQVASIRTLGDLHRAITAGR